MFDPVTAQYNDNQRERHSGRGARRQIGNLYARRGEATSSAIGVGVRRAEGNAYKAYHASCVLGVEENFVMDS
jgi:hypothetical protein